MARSRHMAPIQETNCRAAAVKAETSLRGRSMECHLSTVKRWHGRFQLYGASVTDSAPLFTGG